MRYLDYGRCHAPSRHKMKMVRHQCIYDNAYLVVRGGLPELFQEGPVICIISKDRFLPVAPVVHVVVFTVRYWFASVHRFVESVLLKASFFRGRPRLKEGFNQAGALHKCSTTFLITAVCMYRPRREEGFGPSDMWQYPCCTCRIPEAPVR